MAYNSAYTGQQIDAAVGAVTQKESTWDSKQDALSGTEDQIVGFNSAGNATPIPKPIGLPEGGTTGQMLYKGESGIEWGNKPIMVVTVTSQTGGYVADKTFAEISDAYQSGFAIYASIDGMFMPLFSFVSGATAVFQNNMISDPTGAYKINVIINSDNSVELEETELKLSADKVTFSHGTTGLVSTDVQGAIEELAGKPSGVPKYVSVTLPASAWSNDAQTVTVNGVLADETKQLIQPMPAMASQSAYYGAGVLCSGQAANSLTFTCQTVPTADLTVYIVMQEVGA